MSEASRVRVSGPLAVYAPELIEYLAERGYCDRPAAKHVRRLAHLSRWLRDHRLDAAAVDEAVVARAVAALHRRGKGRSYTAKSYRVVVSFLRERAVAPAATPPALTPMEVLLEDYRGWLRVERGLAETTIGIYLHAAVWFAADACNNDTDRIASLGAKDIAAFVLRVSARRQPRSVNEVVVGVRSLLRFFYQRELVATPLAQATPWLARAARSCLPRTVAPGTGQLLLEHCAGDSVVRVRDRAVITVLVRLGLRANEVAAMELDDIDWRRGELLVRSKGGWRDPLPIPVDVGEAIAAYLAKRGTDASGRAVFLHVLAPGGRITMTDVRAIVRRACERAGIPDTSAHPLRHSVATAMLRGGAPLPEIGQVLRHRDLLTTAIYAKVDFDALATVAQAWPGAKP